MTEEDLYPLLAPLADGKVYPYIVPLGADGQPSVTLPWIIFSIISDVSSDVLSGQAEAAISVQIDVYALDIVEARNLREQALQAVKSFHPTGISRTPGYESDSHYHRATLEFHVTV